MDNTIVSYPAPLFGAGFSATAPTRMRGFGARGIGKQEKKNIALKTFGIQIPACV